MNEFIVAAWGAFFAGIFIVLRHSLSKDRSRTEKINDAIHKFFYEFADIERILTTPGRLVTSDQIKNFEVNHRKAFIVLGNELKGYIGRRTLQGLDKAWCEYQTATQEYYKAPVKATFEPDKTDFLNAIYNLKSCASKSKSRFSHF